MTEPFAGPGKFASPAASGLLLLVWQMPSDRALTGWCPYGPVSLTSLNEKQLTDWLLEQLCMTADEAADWHATAENPETTAVS